MALKMYVRLIQLSCRFSHESSLFLAHGRTSRFHRRDFPNNSFHPESQLSPISRLAFRHPQEPGISSMNPHPLVVPEQRQSHGPQSHCLVAEKIKKTEENSRHKSPISVIGPKEREISSPH